ncbi:MAG: hypothetical protein K2V38_18755 [Gemmataceae bacterium]|nr:hypothetical protein [Gemmataceae bacterium]
MDGLEFTACEPARSQDVRVVKVSVLKGDTLRLGLNEAAFAALGSPQRLKVEAASGDGGDFLRLSGAGPGEAAWEVSVRPALPNWARMLDEIELAAAESGA